MELKPGYKQTEVGVIPVEWEVSGLQQACRETITYGIVQCGPHIRDGVPYIRVSDMDEPELTVDAMLRTSKSIASKFARSTVEEGDLVYALRGKLGEVRQVRAELAGANLTQGTARLSPNDRLVSDYLVWAMRDPRAVRQAALEAKGTTFREITLADLRRIKILVPPKPEQSAIATALSDVDGLLGGLDRLIAKKRDLKQAAMQQLLTGQTRLPGFHGEWEVKRLGDVATFYKGKGLPKSALSESGAEPCIHYGELFTRYPETIGEIFSRTDTSEGVFRSVANDVLMPTSDVTPRGLAKASCVRVDGVILGGDILVIRSDINLVHGPFLSLVIRYEETQVLQLVTGSTVYHLYGSDMKNFAFSIPTLAEQTAIATVLSEMDGELAVLEHRREKTRSLKQAMMQELLTGRTRLVPARVTEHDSQGKNPTL
jgi:type I restriction enzyme S subunit